MRQKVSLFIITTYKKSTISVTNIEHRQYQTMSKLSTESNQPTITRIRNNLMNNSGLKSICICIVQAI